MDTLRNSQSIIMSYSVPKTVGVFMNSLEAPLLVRDQLLPATTEVHLLGCNDLHVQAPESFLVNEKEK